MRKTLLLLVFLAALPGFAAPRLALFDFTDINGKASDEGAELALLILPGISSLENVDMIERKDLDKVLQEHKLVNSGLTQSQYLMLGTLLKADYLITGRIYRLDGQKIINLKLIDCRTGDVSGKSFTLPQKDATTAVKPLSDYLINKISMLKSASPVH